MVITRLQQACAYSGNTTASCTCAMEGFKKKMTTQQQDFLMMPAENATINDLPMIDALKETINKELENCEAEFIY